jgi:hypothetical protein
MAAAALGGIGATLTIWLIAVAGLVLGACGAVLGLSSRRRYRTIEERLAQIEIAAKRAREREAQRAKLRAFVEQELTVKWYLTVQNEGQGVARDCTVSINGSSLEQSSMVDARQLDLAALSVVDGHGAVRIPLKTPTRPNRLQVELSWSDPSGELGLYEADLTGSGHPPDAIEH